MRFGAVRVLSVRSIRWLCRVVPGLPVVNPIGVLTARALPVCLNALCSAHFKLGDIRVCNEVPVVVGITCRTHILVDVHRVRHLRALLVGEVLARDGHREDDLLRFLGVDCQSIALTRYQPLACSQLPMARDTRMASFFGTCICIILQQAEVNTIGSRCSVSQTDICHAAIVRE